MIFQKMYQMTLRYSGHPKAPWYLGFIAFIESFIFPIPPDVMLISMGLAKPESAWRNAFIASFASVVGGILGYLIGLFLFDLIEPWLIHSSFNAAYETACHWFKEYGVWMVIVAGFTPIPYKIFTITAGATHMVFLPFVIASIIGRSLRFFLVSTIFYFYGKRLEKKLVHLIDALSLGILALIGIIYLVSKFI
jgi:membrane protein YqaA with SNARE-associated domain